MLRAQSQGELKMTISVKSFPIGESDFEAIIDEGKIYIDKTSYLKSLLTSAVEVFHFLRPHGFGKTLSMSMLSTFLEMNYENPEDRSRQENQAGRKIFLRILKFSKKTGSSVTSTWGAIR